MMKRFLCAFLCTLMILGTVVLPSAAADLNDRVVAWFDFEGSTVEEKTADKAKAGSVADKVSIKGQDVKFENGLACAPEISGNVLLVNATDDIRDLAGKSLYVRFRPGEISPETWNANGNDVLHFRGDSVIRLWTKSDKEGKTFSFGTWMFDYNESTEKFDHAEKYTRGNGFVHMVYTIAKQNNVMTLRIYTSLDGVNYSEMSETYTDANTVWKQLTLGKLNTDGKSGRGKPIEYDDIRIYNCVLTAAEIASIADDTPAGVVGEVPAARPSLTNFAKVNTYQSGRFSDVKDSDWFAANVGSVYAYGLMNGNSETTFNPTGNITVAETITLLARIRAIYTGKSIDTASASPWYQPYVNFVRDEGIIPEAFADYNAVISRADFARMLVLSVDGDDLAEKNTVENGAIPDVKTGELYSASVYRLYRAGILTGSDEKGTFNPASGISRAEAAAIVTRIIDSNLRKSVTLKAPAKLDTITKVESTKMTLKNIFANDMLIQQNKPFSITGIYKAAVGDYRAELYRGETLVQSVPVVLDPITGTFKAAFAAVKGSYDKYTLRIMGGTYKVAELKNLLFGELWIASGQSNMAYTLTKDQDYPEAFKKDEFIRVMKVGRPSSGYAKEPLAENTTTDWIVGTNQSEMETVTAVGYYFARNLREELDVPVGLIFYAIGGTKIRSWISRETIEANPILTTASPLAKNYKPLAAWDTAGNNQACAIYNTLVAPSLGLNAAGMIWYQGEADLGDRTGYYTKELEIMHKQYSRLYGYGDAGMPFIMANIMPYLVNANPHYYGKMSADVAAYAAGNEKVAAVWLGGLSPEHDDNNSASHPHEKVPVGRRLADSAMAMVYGEKYDEDGPIAVSSTVKGNTMTLTFANVADGLCIADGSSVLRGFKVCGADGVYYPADARIVGKDKVEVSSPNVDKPISAAYAYELNVYYLNLGCTYQGEPLFMASPFVLNAPAKTTVIPTILYADCDLPRAWHLTQQGGHFACEYDTWTAEQNKTALSVSFDTADKAQGDAALKVAVPAAGEVLVKPTLVGPGKNGTPTLFTDTVNDYSAFRQLTVKIKNDTDQPLTVNPFRISSGYAGPSVSTIPAKSGWVEVAFDLKNLYTASGAVASNVPLDKFAVMQLSFTAGGAGSIGVDDLQFLTAERTGTPAAPVTPVAPAATNALNEYVVTWFDFEGSDDTARLADKASGGSVKDVLTVNDSGVKLTDGHALIGAEDGSVMLLKKSEDIADLNGKTIFACVKAIAPRRGRQGQFHLPSRPDTGLRCPLDGKRRG